MTSSSGVDWILAKFKEHSIEFNTRSKVIAEIYNHNKDMPR